MINKSKKEIYKDLGNQKLDHFFRFNSSQFSLPIEEVYNQMKEYYKLDIKEYKDLIFKKQEEHIYNSQLTQGKPYKTKGKGKVGVYNSKRLDNDNKGTNINNVKLKYILSIHVKTNIHKLNINCICSVIKIFLIVTHEESFLRDFIVLPHDILILHKCVKIPTNNGKGIEQ